MLSPFSYPLEGKRSQQRVEGRVAAIAELASNLACSSVFFALCLAVVFVWIVTLLTGVSSATDNDLTGAMTAMTLLLVAVLKNSERRAERAMQLKLDAIAAALLAEGGKKLDQKSRADLEDAVRLHEEL